jgi:hypothetical protein
VDQSNKSDYDSIFSNISQNNSAALLAQSVERVTVRLSLNY